MKQRVEEMEREAKKLRELQAAAEASSGGDENDNQESEEDKAVSHDLDMDMYPQNRMTCNAKLRIIETIWCSVLLVVLKFSSILLSLKICG